MFIQTEATPNPAVIKFLPGRPVLPDGSREFLSAEEAAISPLATRLFGIDGIRGIFCGADFIAITKDDAIDWQLVKPAVLGTIMEHYLSGVDILSVSDSAQKDLKEDFDDKDVGIVDAIKDLLATRVRPAVASDGGDIVFHGYREGVVYLHMQGACAGCPSSTITLKSGIENLLRYFIPEVVEVRAIEL